MERGYLYRKPYLQYFAMFAAVLIFLACVALFIVIVHGYASKGVLIAAGWASFAVAIFLPMGVAILVPMFDRKPSQPVNYPRIEHLRIAGKYAPTGAAKIGVSPLHLR
ncbi:MAG: hypothetical protein WBQ34_10665 [Candidatus Acidiferrales bacterium]